MERTIAIGSAERRVAFEKSGDAYAVVIDGREYRVEQASIRDGVLTFFIGDRTYRALVSNNALGMQISLDGRDYFLDVGDTDESTAAGAHHGGDGSVEAPMPGNIVAVNVKPGDTVSPGDSVVIVESMKMQNEITAPVAGEVTSVNCSTGDQVSFGQLLVEIEPTG
jgi:biotin carboxyl carrier protein